jgi:hypothetical protein
MKTHGTGNALKEHAHGGKVIGTDTSESERWGKSRKWLAHIMGLW